MGYAFPDNVGFLVDLPNRSSLSPNAAFYIGELRGDRSCKALRWLEPVQPEYNHKSQSAI